MRSSQHETPEGSSGQSSTMDIDQTELPNTTTNQTLEQSSQLSSTTSSFYYHSSLSFWQQNKNVPTPVNGNKRKQILSEDSSEKKAENVPSTPNKRRRTSSANSSKKPLQSENFFYKKTEERVQEGLEVIPEGRGRNSKYYVMRNGIKTQILTKNAMEGRRYRYLNEELVSDSDKAKVKKGEKKRGGQRRYYVEKSKDELIEVMRTYAIKKRKAKNKKFKFSDDDSPIPLTAKIVKLNNKFYAEMEDGSKKEVLEKNPKKIKKTEQAEHPSQKKILFYKDTGLQVEENASVIEKKTKRGSIYYVMRNNIKIRAVTQIAIKGRDFYYLNGEKVLSSLIEKISTGDGIKEPYSFIRISETKRIEVVTHSTLYKRKDLNKRFKFPDNTPITVAALLVRVGEKYYARMEDGTEKEVVERVFPKDKELLGGETQNLTPMTTTMTHRDSSNENEPASNTSEVELNSGVVSMFLFGRTPPNLANNHGLSEEEIKNEYDVFMSKLSVPNPS